MMIPNSMLYAAHAKYRNPMGNAVSPTLFTDIMLEMALHDYIVEQGDSMDCFKVGEKYIIFTVTLYFVGRCKYVGFGYIDMEDCSWIHWAGNLTTLMTTQSFNHPDFGDRQPHTQYMGDFTVFLGGGIGKKDWRGELPAISNMPAAEEESENPEDEEDQDEEVEATEGRELA